MNIIVVDEIKKEDYNRIVSHPLQSYEWGEFRKKSGITVVRNAIEENGQLLFGFTTTLHKIPKTPYTIAYLPKTKFPPKLAVEELKKIAKTYRSVFVQLEPNIIEAVHNVKTSIKQDLEHKHLLTYPGFKPSFHPLFTKFTFQIDLTKSEDELLAQMHPKTRYNIRLAKKHGVEVAENDSDAAFERYWELTEETTKRQHFWAHTKRYHELQWETFPHKPTRHTLSSHLFVGKYEGKILTTYLLFVFNDTMYYTYGATSDEARNTMHATLTMWEAMRYAKKLGLKFFDMWGSLGPNPDPKDPWYGFTRFKTGFGGELIEFVGSFDLVTNPALYQIYKLADIGRKVYLRIKR